MALELINPEELPTPASYTQVIAAIKGPVVGAGQQEVDLSDRRRAQAPAHMSNAAVVAVVHLGGAVLNVRAAVAVMPAALQLPANA